MNKPDINAFISGLPKPPRAFAVGDEVSIYLARHQGERTPGTVVAVLTLPGWIHEHYVIECEVGAPDPELEVRSGYTTWPRDENRKIPSQRHADDN